MTNNFIFIVLDENVKEVEVTYQVSFLTCCTWTTANQISFQCRWKATKRWSFGQEKLPAMWCNTRFISINVPQSYILSKKKTKERCTRLCLLTIEVAREGRVDGDVWALKEEKGIWGHVRLSRVHRKMWHSYLMACIESFSLLSLN